MKKWQKVLTGIVCAVAVAVIGGAVTYEKVIKPKYVEPLAEKAAEYLKDENVQKEVENLAQQMIEDGVLDGETVASLQQSEILTGEQPQEAAEENQDSEEQTQPEEKTDESKSSEPEASDPENTQSAQQQSKPSQQTQSAQQQSQSTSNNSASNNSTSDKSSSQNKSSSSGGSAYSRIKEAASAEEFAQGSAILSKINAGKFSSLMKTDKKAAKEYLYSCLSPGEIQTALRLYAKYSYLL